MATSRHDQRSVDRERIGAVVAQHPAFEVHVAGAGLWISNHSPLESKTRDGFCITSEMTRLGAVTASAAAAGPAPENNATTHSAHTDFMAETSAVQHRI